MSILIVLGKGLAGGLGVVAFALLGQAGHPKRFAGLFAAAPAVAVASLSLTVALKGPAATVPYAQGMLIGSAGMLIYCLVSMYLVERLHALPGSVLAWLAWIVVAGGLYLAVGR
jgi:hypothetical protein